MLQNSLEDSTVASTDDQNPLWVSMRQQRHMYKHFLINEFVCFGDLDCAIQYKNASVACAIENQDFLEFRCHFRKLTYLLEALSPTGVQRFIDPVGQSDFPRRSSLSVTRFGRNAARRTGIESCGSQAPHMKMSMAAKPTFRPRVYRDVAFRQHDNTGHSAVRSKMMEVAVQNCGASTECRLP